MTVMPRLTNFESTSIVRGDHRNAHATARATSDILERADAITRKSGVFAFGMVVIEVVL